MQAVAAFGLCAALAWIAQFHHFGDFGLYEDDYFFIGRAMGQGPEYLASRFQTAVTTLPQGRPLGFFLPDLLSFSGDKLGGLAAMYLLGWLIVSLNTFLAFRLLRTRLPVSPAIVGAAVFCLFPPDTTKFLLTHDFQLQPSLTFALLAALAYATGRTPLTYVLGAGALVSYESGYLALFGLPFFARPWDWRLPRAVVINAASLLFVLVLVVVARMLVGEGRATSSAGSVGGVLLPLLGSLVLGPLRSLAGMFYGPLKAVPGWDVEALSASVLALFGFGAVLLWTTRRGGAADAKETEHVSSRADAPLRMIGAGLVMLVLGYGLAFTHFPPNALVGRGTSVHLGATIGMSALSAGIAWLLLRTRPGFATAVLASYLALAVGYYAIIERDFIHAWQLERSFWRDVVSCCTDLQDGTILLYELRPTEEPTFIFSNSWADALVLDQTFAFPSTWSTPPRLFSVTSWTDRVQVDGDHLRWWVPGASWDEHWEVLPQQNVIVLRRDADGHLVRVTDSVEILGQSLELKPPGTPQEWPPAQLYKPLLR